MNHSEAGLIPPFSRRSLTDRIDFADAASDLEQQPLNLRVVANLIRKLADRITKKQYDKVFDCFSKRPAHCGKVVETRMDIDPGEGGDVFAAAGPFVQFSQQSPCIIAPPGASVGQTQNPM